MSKHEQEHLRELAARATPGPWYHDGQKVWASDRPDPKHSYRNLRFSDKICQTAPRSTRPGRAGGSSVANAAFISAANPNAIVALLDRIIELEANQLITGN